MFRSLFVEKSENELLAAFFKWVVHQGWWNQFWATFRADGIMSWLEFENFVHWDGKWTGDKRRVFKELAKHCGTDQDHPYLTASGVLDLKRWWENMDDPGKAVNIETFRKIFAEHYGNMGCAWRMALDPEDTGKCSFLVFCRICNSLGMRKNLKSIWEELTDGNPHRPILYSDWDPVGDRLVGRFAMALTLKYGGMREGWNEIVKNAGGNMHFASFVDSCSDMSFTLVEARWLFLVLDKEKRRYLNQFDRLRFLLHWDPGQDAPDMTVQELQFSSFKPKTRYGKGSKKESGEVVQTPFRLSHKNPFEFMLELTDEEYAEFQARLQTRLLIVGQDEKAMDQYMKKTDRKQKEHAAKARIQGVLSRPLVSRKFNNDELMKDPVIAEFAEG
jgi:hypothetical protein